MQIVVDIPENIFKKLEHQQYYDVDVICNAILSGTSLPKGHGRLIDGDKAIADFANYGIDHMWDAADLPYIIDESPIIIEADEGSEE